MIDFWKIIFLYRHDMKISPKNQSVKKKHLVWHTRIVSSARSEWVSNVTGQTFADGDAAAHLAVGIVSARSLARADAAVVAARAVAGALVVGGAVAATALAVRVAGVSRQAGAHGTSAHVAALGVGAARAARQAGVDLDALHHDALLGYRTALDQRVAQLNKYSEFFIGCGFIEMLKARGTKALGRAHWLQLNYLVYTLSTVRRCVVEFVNSDAWNSMWWCASKKLKVIMFFCFRLDHSS